VLGRGKRAGSGVVRILQLLRQVRLREALE
jgi:hypothetical protein